MDFGSCPSKNHLLLYLFPATFEPLCVCRVCIALYMRACDELTGPSCVLLCERPSHEDLRGQEEAPWNRKESNVWERGGYLLPFDLLWSELECVL